MNLYSAFVVVPHTQGAQVRITQCYLQITPYLPLPRKHSPDGASPDWGCRHLVAANLGNNCLLFARELHLLLNISTLQLELLRFRYFRFGFGRFWAKNRGIFFLRFWFFHTKNVYRTTHNVHKKTIKPITLRRTIHQMDNIVMFVCKLAVYVMQLLHIKAQKVNLLHFSM